MNDLSDHAMMTDSEVTPKKVRACLGCHKFANARDPHDICVRCRGTACGSDDRCVQCLHLHESAHKVYTDYAFETLQAELGAASRGTPRPRKLSVSSALSHASSPAPAAFSESDLSALILRLMAQQQTTNPSLPVGPSRLKGAELDTQSVSTASVASDQSSGPPPLLSVADRVAMVFGMFPNMPLPKPSAPSIQGSVGTVSAKDPVSERAFPTASLLGSVAGTLDDAFKLSSLRTLPLSLPSWQRTSFPVHDLPFAGQAPSVEGHVERLGVKGSPAVEVSQTQLSTFDSLARHSLQALSHADTYLAAAASVVEGSSREPDIKLINCLVGINASLEYLTGAASYSSGHFTHMRRQAFLSASVLDATNRETLVQQPWSGQALFNHHIPAVLKDHQASVAALAAQKSLAFMGSLGNRSAPKPTASSGAVSSAKGTAPKRPFRHGERGHKASGGTSGKKGKWTSQKPTKPSSK